MNNPPVAQSKASGRGRRGVGASSNVSQKQRQPLQLSLLSANACFPVIRQTAEITTQTNQLLPICLTNPPQ